MVEVITDRDILESKAQTLINTVNCVGVMGKGIALQLKKKFPDMYQDYLYRCQRGLIKLGQPYLYRRPDKPWIINFPTKDHWRSMASIDAIIKGMQYLLNHYKEWGITSIAVPPLGCGEGQLEWRVVGPTLYRHLKQMDIPAELYAPYGTPAIETQSSFLSQLSEPVFADASVGSFKIKPDWIALVEVLYRIENEPYHWPVGRVAFQKIAYFATEAGFSTDLTYIQGSYGPYAPNLKLKVNQLINNGLINEERLGNMIHVVTGYTFPDARKAYLRSMGFREKGISEIVNLFLRMTTHQSEIAATVHFAAKLLQKETNEIPTENQVLSYVMNWKERRRPPLDTGEAAKAIRNLAALGWLKVKPSADLPLPAEVTCEI
jgi:O-acetyl-ADP-ribose deacetylase (regulator of RNase III)/uncharacterized protein YwgA